MIPVFAREIHIHILSWLSWNDIRRGGSGLYLVGPGIVNASFPPGHEINARCPLTISPMPKPMGQLGASQRGTFDKKGAVDMKFGETKFRHKSYVPGPGTDGRWGIRLENLWSSVTSIGFLEQNENKCIYFPSREQLSVVFDLVFHLPMKKWSIICNMNKFSWRNHLIFWLMNEN